MYEELIILYKKYAILFCTYTISGPYFKANKIFDKLTDIRKRVEYEYNKEQIEKFYEQLLFDENIYVKFSAASYCLRIGIFIKKASQILEKISKDKNIHHAIKFDAKMSLQEYQKNN